MASTSTALESKIWCVAAVRGTSVLGVKGDTPGKARAWCHVRRISAENVRSVKRIISRKGIRGRDSPM